MSGGDLKPALPIWHVAVDRGGTFVDLVARTESGDRRVLKLLAGEGQESRGIDRLLETEGGRLGSLRIGTTVGTNALLTSDGRSVGLLTTAGHEDVLALGDGRRANLFELAVTCRRTHCFAVRGVSARNRADGGQERPLCMDEVAARLAELRALGVEHLAVSFVHSTVAPEHEVLAGEAAERLGFSSVVLGHLQSPGPGFLERTETAVAAALVAGPLADYRRSLLRSLPTRVPLSFMTSSGDLAKDTSFRAVDSVFSGPAGGAVGCGVVAERLGLSAVIGFDMGGTSTDVCRWAGRLNLRRGVQIGGSQVRVPSVDVETVAAGGGSILRLEDGRSQVGPMSAGASPGPSCYGVQGPPTVTDANLVLGRLRAEHVPKVFGPKGNEGLDLASAQQSLRALDPRAAEDPTGTAAGFVGVANARMASAIKELCLRRGEDPSEHALVAFGGAAGQHVCAVAQNLEIDSAVVPGEASVLSAAGIGAADHALRRSTSVSEPWDDGLPGRWEQALEDLREELAAVLRVEPRDDGVSFETTWFLRYRGAREEIACIGLEDFEDAHRRRFGFVRSDVPVEATRVEVRLEVNTDTACLSHTPGSLEESTQSLGAKSSASFLYVDSEGDGWPSEGPVYTWAELPPGVTGDGPALIVGVTTSVVVDPGWSFKLSRWGDVVLSRERRQEQARSFDQRTHRLELCFARFTSLAERMGARLERLAWSVNVRDRLDFSCAVFDSSGGLVTNAPHIPVHLGAMGETLRGLIERLETPCRPGQAWAVNDPRLGGSHLPDITVLTPVFWEGEVAAWVGSRAHHSDVGGITPGSMPPFSKSLVEEGVVFRDVLLTEAGVLKQEALRSLLNGGPWPSRATEQVIADLEAQLAAGAGGVAELNRLFERNGCERVQGWMTAIQDNGEEVVRDWIETLQESEYEFEDGLDDGSTIRVVIRRGADSRGAVLDFDFDGTAGPSPGNLNATPAVVRAAVLYVVRCLVGREVPLNEGFLRPLRIRLPGASILSPPSGAAVVGGNVETSQRVVDVLLGALGGAAASQGTMNNLTLGAPGFAYYETIPGGVGALCGAGGAHGVHSHMTNTRITDVEHLEARGPVLLESFELRSGSGGAGAFSGGDGVRRRFRALGPVQVALLSERRRSRPYGMEGGAPGQPGGAVRIGLDGRQVALGGAFEIQLREGEEIMVESPGGGGFGPPD